MARSLPFINTTVHANGTEITPEGFSLSNTSMVGKYRGTSTIGKHSVVVVTSGAQAERYVRLDEKFSWA